MSKYIKLDSANDAIVTVLEHTDCRDEHIDSVLRRIDNLPTIEASEDCISRADALAAFEEIEEITALSHIELGEEPTDGTEEIMVQMRSIKNILNRLPSVVPDRPRGEWIVEHGILAGDGIYGDMYHCSECGIHERDVDGLNFCANCGALMEGESE